MVFHVKIGYTKFGFGGTSNIKISVVWYLPHMGVFSGYYVCYINLTYLCITYMGYIELSGYFLNCDY